MNPSFESQISPVASESGNPSLLEQSQAHEPQEHDEAGLGFENDNHFTYLAPGMPHIIACVGDREQHAGTLDVREDEIRELLQGDAGNNTVANTDNTVVGNNPDIYEIDFYEDPDKLSDKGHKNGGEMTYIISAIDNANKYSTNYHDCTGLVVVGRDKETGQEISFLTHQNPDNIINEGLQNFSNDLSERLIDLRSRCEEGTVDAVLFGGKLFNTLDRHDYDEMIETVSGITSGALGFKPNIIRKPKQGKLLGDIAVFDNSHRRLYFMREERELPSVEDIIKAVVSRGEESN
jgi:hypothetical protein